MRPRALLLAIGLGGAAVTNATTARARRQGRGSREVARQSRIDRRVVEDAVVRVALQDRDGTVLFEGKVR